MRRRWIFGLLIFLSVNVQADRFIIGAFSDLAPEDAIPSAWQPLRPAPKAVSTRYRLVSDDGVTVLRADADRSMSGLVRALRIDVKRYPILRWRWKIAAPLKTADMKTKAGDDYAVRLYVLFDYDAGRLALVDRIKLKLARSLYGLEIPTAALNYVWDNRYPVGTIMPNAYTDRARLIVVESGAAKAGQWVTETRNVADDFRTAFDEDPPDIDRYRARDRYR